MRPSVTLNNFRLLILCSNLHWPWIAPHLGLLQGTSLHHLISRVSSRCLFFFQCHQPANSPASICLLPSLPSFASPTIIIHLTHANKTLCGRMLRLLSESSSAAVSLAAPTHWNLLTNSPADPSAFFLFFLSNSKRDDQTLLLLLLVVVEPPFCPPFSSSTALGFVRCLDPSQ